MSNLDNQFLRTSQQLEMPEILYKLEIKSRMARGAEQITSEFLFTMSSQIRTYVNTIIGVTWMILEDLLDEPEEEKEFLELAYNAAIDLLNFINEISELSKEFGKVTNEFLFNVSCELRTPLNQSMGFISMVLEDLVDDDPVEKEFIQEAYNASICLLNIINDILDIVKIVHGTMTLEMDVVKLSDLFEDVEKLMRLQAERENLSFSLQIPPTNTEIFVYGNYQRLKQVMLNLVGNAIDFTQKGSFIISFDVVQEKVQFQNREFPGTIKVSIADTGIDVSLDEKYKLYKLFSTCFGLTISQKLIEAMGGIINFSSLGERFGSKVIFTVLMDK